MKTTMFFKVGLFLIITGLITMVVVNTNNSVRKENKKLIPEGRYRDKVKSKGVRCGILR